MPISPDLRPGDVWWAWLDPIRGREHGGRRAVLLVASAQFVDVIDTLALVVPVTSVDRQWPNHIRLSTLTTSSFAMTEQLRTISRERLHSRMGAATSDELAEVRLWLADFLDLPVPPHRYAETPA